MVLSSREKLLVGGLVLVGLGLAIYTLVHEPLITRRAEAREKLEQVESELLQEENKLAKEGDLAERKAKVTAREQLIDSWVPGKNSAALLIWHLSQAEQISGTRIDGISVGEKSLVNVSGQPDDPSASQGTDQGQAPKTEQKAQGSSVPEGTMTSLVVVPLELEVVGKFTEHLIFNQYMEEVPLFLATHGIKLSRQGALPLERVGKLVQGGNPWLAEQILSESPAVGGSYRVNLYFKAEKPGPSTDEMQFGSQPGRVDPFVMAAVDEFIRMLQDYFNGERSDDPSSPPSLPPTLPQPKPPQLG